MSAWWVLPVNYLIGSLPFGLLLGWLVRGVDIRKYGSGNIGATNLFRVAGFAPGVLSGVCDALKGFVGAYLATRFVPDPYLWLAAVLLIVVGHNWSCFLGFKGGKGVATTLGVVFYLSWPTGIICFLSWILTVAVSRYSSLGSLMGAILMPVFLYVFQEKSTAIWWGILTGGLVFLRHKENLRRLYQGKELKIGQKGESE
ncbi:MAG TPA: glycerol-3-phosphate 1-O-acyltransferase PlsY [Atribacteraceae bacterium]|nr:glycerol-3-phosphate 1-O-acyltransferase PlsY [Atribacteraceae bacterium]